MYVPRFTNLHICITVFKNMYYYRMKMIMKRAQMISDIQELHKVVFMLQTELDLLLLKTYPTLYVKPQSTNIRK